MDIIGFIKSNWPGLIGGLSLLCTIIWILMNLYWRRYRLKVIPVIADIKDINGKHLAHHGLGVRVINTGGSPVEISDVGICDYSRLTRKSINKITLCTTASADTEPLPKLLQPNQTYTGLFNPGFTQSKESIKLRTAYARTSTGRHFYGRSRGLHRYMNIWRGVLAEKR